MNWRVKFRLFQTLTYSIVFSAIAIMCLITGKWIETVGLFIAFVVLRNTFGKTYHSQSFWRCIAITVIVFVVSILLLPNKNISLLISIIFGFAIDFIAYKYQDYIDLKLEINKPKTFSVENCTEAELIIRCNQLNLSEETTKLAIEFFVKKTKQSIIAETLCIDEKSVQTKKRRLKKKLNKN